MLALLGIEQRRIERLPGVRRVRGDVGEDASRHVGHILELHAAQVDPGFVLELVHHRVVQSLLVGEVPVDGAFVDACPFGHGPDREPVPVPHRRAVQELGPGGDDALPGLGGPLAPQVLSYERRAAAGAVGCAPSVVATAVMDSSRSTTS